MLGQRLSAWFSKDHGGVVKDVLSGKERIIPLVVQRPCRTASSCRFAALNFVRVALRHGQPARGNAASPSMARWLSVMTERHILEETLTPCEQLTGQEALQLEQMACVPLFKNALRHVTTRHGPPSMILFKQSLRQMQLHALPVSAMIVSRNASTTVCLKLRENSKDVFVVLDFPLAIAEHEHAHACGTPLALVISTSLEQTAARLSGISPVDNHLVTHDRRWQAQLFAICTICLFMPTGEDTSSLDAESMAIQESIALLRPMGEVDDQRPEGQGERESNASRERYQQNRRSNIRASELGHGEPLGRSSHRQTPRIGGGQLAEGPSVRVAELHPGPTHRPYEETKRHCRIFFLGDGPSITRSPSPNPKPTPVSSAASGEEAKFECVICFEDIPEAERVRLLPCAHGFCRTCLAGHVSSKIEERKFPVFCPLCIANQENSNPSAVSGALVQQLGVSKAQHAIWSELEMAHFCVRVHCRRCNRSAFVDREGHEKLEEVRCPSSGCGHTWCKNCQQTLSNDGPKHSCDGTQELDHLVKQMGWKYCPKCRTPVQKNGGCNHMTCASPGCNTHFCYKCGKQITRTPIPFLVRSAVNAHFKQCTL